MNFKNVFNLKIKIFLILFVFLAAGLFFILPKIIKSALHFELTLNQATVIVDFIILTILLVYYYFKITESQIKTFINISRSKLKKIKLPSLILFILTFLFGLYYFNVVHKTESLNLFYPRTIYGFVQTVSIFIERISMVYGFLLGITFLLTYRILRFTLNRLLSNFCALIFISSEIHLYNLIPSIERDYFKVILFLLLSILFILIFKSSDNRKGNIKFYLIAIIIGFSLTIRNDFLIYVIPFFISAFIFYERPLKKILTYSFIIIFIFLIIPARGTLVSSMPIVLLTGLMGNFDLMLGQTNDYVISNISEQPLVEYYLDKINTHYLLFYLKYIITFPFDAFTKIVFALNEILNLSYIYSSQPIIFEGNIKNIYLIKNFLFENFIGFGSFLFIFSLILLKGLFSNNKLYFLLILYIFYLLSSSTIYFYVRHYFHLEILSLWSLFYLIQNCSNFFLNAK
tara:strand:+ start:862 stop:2232 length:1371 start_codon:yes stop_codon:yes gene_type:complete